MSAIETGGTERYRYRASDADGRMVEGVVQAASRGVALEIVDDPECVALMREFIAARPELWNEDIGA